MKTRPEAVSFHLAVDDKEVVQGLPYSRNGWHAGDGASGTGNRKSVGIEICYSKSGGVRYQNAERNAIKVIASLCRQLGLRPSKNTLKMHRNWSNTSCPNRINSSNWDRVVTAIIDEHRRITQQTTSYPLRKVGDMVRVNSSATHYQTGQPIANFVKGNIYRVNQVKSVNQSRSRRAYLLSSINSWVLEQDVQGVASGGEQFSANYYTTNPGRVRLKVRDGLYARNDLNFTGGRVGGTYPAGTIFRIVSIVRRSDGLPRLVTESGYLLTANRNYVEKV
ncbi:DUF5776 domain-containing protein [Vagococcus salmoninarum]|uniref:DUF5776 domain-containing protein n=1 Tax=Vagococcus salmoninarum TaxID=2739 RepID=UPI00187F91BC|nr:N-acetylmuramoyl-L-alanine amidase [Vagococcus salmoninarum]